MKKIKFNISMDPNKDVSFETLEEVGDFLVIPYSVFAQMVYPHQDHPVTKALHLGIDEEVLLPGSNEPTEISGILNTVKEDSQTLGIKFTPIAEQTNLHKLQLTSKGVPLHYTLNEHAQMLSATAGTDGNKIFEVKLDEDGTYTFKLHGHIDREPPPNLLKNSDFSKMKKQEKSNKSIEGWEFQFDKQYSSLFQQIPTDPSTSYQLTLLLLPQLMKNIDTQALQLYWNDQLIHTIDSNYQTHKGFTFTVEGNPLTSQSTLSLVSQDPHASFVQYLDYIQVISQSQNKLPIDFNYEINSDNHKISYDHFMINVTTTPAIEISNHIPFDIIYEQGVYQTIIVSDDSHQQNPLTTINLDPLFNNLAIPTDSRHVEIIQREENGTATNVYEVKISAGVGSTPITVADVLLSFPGGDGGLHVFNRNVVIDEGGSTPPPHDHIL